MRTAIAALALALTVCSACRQGTSLVTTTGGQLPASSFGAHGCSSPAQVFGAPQVPTVVDLTGVTLVLGPSSHVAAARGGEMLYATGAGATLSLLDFTLGEPPAETVLVTAGVVDAFLALFGTFGPARLSGVAVLDASTLVVVEHTTNTILTVDRVTPDTLGILAGLPSVLPGYADGPDIAARFSFGQSTMLCPTNDGRVFVADAGNHAVRVVDAGFVATVAGAGTPFHDDGDLVATGFDTPSGVVVGCANELLVTEAGSAGVAGHRLRALAVGDPSFFGGFNGTSATLAGDGTSATTQGVDEAAQLSAPVAPASTVDGEVYWIDSGAGILRRHVLATGTSDCPLFADCATALGGPANFTPLGTFSLALTDGGVLYVLDATASTLLRVTP